MTFEFFVAKIKQTQPKVILKHLVLYNIWCTKKRKGPLTAAILKLWRLWVLLPYRFRTADDAFHDVLPDLLSVVFVDVEGENHLSQRGLPVLPVLAHHVLQVDGRYTNAQAESGAREWAKTWSHF